MFNMKLGYNRHYSWHYNWPIIAPIDIKHVHYSVSNQWAIYYKKYDRRGCESPSGYGALGCVHSLKISLKQDKRAVFQYNSTSSQSSYPV